MGFLLDIEPGDLGFKAPFTKYRPIQNEVIDWACEGFSEGVQFMGASCPTGSGKTILAVSIAKAMGLRTVFVTAFKGLEKQYVDQFSPYGMVDIQGRNNYDCAHYSHLDCRGGSSVGCPYTKGKGCSYEQAKGIAKEASLVTTNYHYWLNVNDKANGIERGEKESEEIGANPFELLVLDECHSSSSIVASYVSCTLYEKDAKLFGKYPMSENLLEWSQWASAQMPVVRELILTATAELMALGKKSTAKHVETLHHVQKLAQTMDKIAWAKGDDWIVEMEQGTKYGRVWKFDCIWPGKYSKQYLICGVPKVLLMSATNKEKTLWDLGIKREEYRYRQWRRIFPGNRHPIYMVSAKKSNGSGIKVGYKTSEQDLDSLIDWIDEQIIKPRLDRKGIIQTVSYNLQRQIMERSKYVKYMIGNTNDPSSESAQEAASAFKLSEPPSLLVSPSFSTGWDFPGSEAEYGILIKVPFVPAVSKIMKARIKKDPSHVNYATMQTIEQGVGRGMRSEGDRFECFLVDANFQWFLFQNKHLAQDWFVGAVRGLPNVPKPPMRLVDELKLAGKK